MTKGLLGRLGNVAKYVGRTAVIGTACLVVACGGGGSMTPNEKHDKEYEDFGLVAPYERLDTSVEEGGWFVTNGFVEDLYNRDSTGREDNRTVMSLGGEVTIGQTYGNGLARLVEDPTTGKHRIFAWFKRDENVTDDTFKINLVASGYDFRRPQDNGAIRDDSIRRVFVDVRDSGAYQNADFMGGEKILVYNPKNTANAERDLSILKNEGYDHIKTPIENLDGNIINASRSLGTGIVGVIGDLTPQSLGAGLAQANNLKAYELSATVGNMHEAIVAADSLRRSTGLPVSIDLPQRELAELMRSGDQSMIMGYQTSTDWMSARSTLWDGELSDFVANDESIRGGTEIPQSLVNTIAVPEYVSDGEQAQFFLNDRATNGVSITTDFVDTSSGNKGLIREDPLQPGVLFPREVADIFSFFN